MRSLWIFGSEQLGQRGRDGDRDRLLAHEGDVGFDGETRGRQGAAHGDDVIAVEAEAVRQDEPALDAAHLLAVAVMIEQAVRPLAAQLAVIEAADEGRVLARDCRLVAVAIECPCLHLRLLQLAAVQHVMERMLVVIALGADGADGSLEVGN